MKPNKMPSDMNAMWCQYCHWFEVRSEDTWESLGDYCPKCHRWGVCRSMGYEYPEGTILVMDEVEV